MTNLNDRLYFRKHIQESIRWRKDREGGHVQDVVFGNKDVFLEHIALSINRILIEHVFIFTMFLINTPSVRSYEILKAHVPCCRFIITQ